MDDNDRHFEALNIRIQDMINLVDSAIIDARADKVTDIGSIEQDIAFLCEEVLSSGTVLAQKMEPQIAIMIGKLESLAIELAALQERMEAKIKEQS